MEVHIGENKLVITTEPKTFHFDLTNDIDNNLRHEIYFIINHNEILPEHTIKNEINQLLSKYNYENDLHEYGKQ